MRAAFTDSSADIFKCMLAGKEVKPGFEGSEFCGRLMREGHVGPPDSRATPKR